MSTTTQWSAPISTPSDLRLDLKQRRQSVSTVRRLLSEQRAINTLTRSKIFRGSKSIAAYISVNAEFTTGNLLLEILRRDKTLYLPVLEGAHPHHMRFARLDSNSRLKKNRFGIPEPVHGKSIPAQRLDLVILPLLGFDRVGNRLGMGGGYYDRTFAFCKQARRLARPYLMGLAYDVQQVDALATQPWDVPLDAVLTESGIRYFTV